MVYKTREARLDLVERRVEFLNQEMTQLRQDHEELKDMYWSLKKKQNERDDSDKKEIKTTEHSYNNLIRMKRPSQLLPVSFLRYLHSINSLNLFSDK